MAKANGFMHQLPKGSLVRASTLMQRFGLTEDESMRVLTTGLSQGILSIKYRINTTSHSKDAGGESPLYNRTGHMRRQKWFTLRSEFRGQTDVVHG